MHPLLITLIFSIGFNLLMFIPAYLFKTDKLTDISYALTFGVVALYGFSKTSFSIWSLLLLSMILLWAIRLGGYLLIRIHKMKKDKRFDIMRENFWSFLRFWLLQGFTVWAVMIPSILFFNNDVTSLPSWALVGIVIWTIGLAIESLADWQKYKFINNPDNKGNWIDTGLWKYSRHPNYFGEILLWTGVFLYTISGLTSLEVWIGAVSPLYIAILIIFVSGIPLLEKAADKRWGQNLKYQEYKKTTSSLITLPKKRSLL